MIILIPLGGIGERFKNLGYKKPKPLINVMGKPIICWLFDNLKLDNVTMVVIPYNKELEKYNFESLITKMYPNINFKFLKMDSQTQGAAETVLKAINAIDVPDCPVLCIDGDNFYLYDIVKHWNGENNVFYFDDDSDSSAFSFLKMIENNLIVDIVEKSRISNYASCGAYGFSSFSDLGRYCKEIITKDIKQKNEYYISGVVKQMIESAHIFYGKNVDKNYYVCLGTPFDVRLFCNNYPRISAFDGTKLIKPQRYCFDLDNTLVTYPKILNDYTTVEPIQTTIDFLKYLKKLGHTIIIYTARRMKTHNGNTGKILADIGKITFETLEKYDIPYDEIYFGKPFADFYIDDSAICPFDDLEKELGFYKSTIETRLFNNITSDVIYTYKKYGSNLCGEIYWYENMPNAIKDMFPLYFGSNDGYYVMERINGIPFSRLMLSGDLTIEHLKHIMNSINRIHNTSIPDSESGKQINIYDNYYQKMKNRYEFYDYSKFKNSKQIYDMLAKKLIKYQSNDMGKISVIHGDTVLTNIMINQFGKIKFIDMRGRISDVVSVLGDKYYDWAKLYQSLIGYDEILENKYLSAPYKNILIKYFEDRFVVEFGEKQLKYLKYLTSSLLFTLIPLHDDHKCDKYYNLIFQIIKL
jgi:capsule biosynthesis phosphatase